MKGQVYLKGVSTLVLDDDACVGCGMCVIVCPHRVFEMDEGKARIRDRDLCMECGACRMNCPAGAIAVNSGVGCAAAVLTQMFGGGASTCDCCVSENKGDSTGGCC